MEPAGRFIRLTQRRKKRSAGKVLEDLQNGSEARGPLFPRCIIYVLLAVFAVSAMLTLDWFGLLFLNADGVIDQMGILNAHRVNAALMTGIAVPSVLLMTHYRRVYSYVSAENVFFAIAFSLSFMMGTPSVMACVFG